MMIKFKSSYLSLIIISKPSFLMMKTKYESFEMSEIPLTFNSASSKAELKYLEEIDSLFNKANRNEVSIANNDWSELFCQTFNWENMPSKKFSNLSNEEIDEVKVDIKFDEGFDLLLDGESVSNLEITPIWLEKELRVAKSNNWKVDYDDIRLHIEEKSFNQNEETHQSTGHSYLIQEFSNNSSCRENYKRIKVSDVDMQRWIVSENWISAINWDSTHQYLNEQVISTTLRNSPLDSISEDDKEFSISFGNDASNKEIIWTENSKFDSFVSNVETHKLKKSKVNKRNQKAKYKEIEEKQINFSNKKLAKDAKKPKNIIRKRTKLVSPGFDNEVIDLAKRRDVVNKTIF